MDFTCLLVDDEKLAIEGLAILLKEFSNCQVIATSSNGKEALDLYYQKPCDVIFLDIEMPIMNGLELAHILNANKPPLIVFITAFDAFAIEAFKENAIDYLLKPIDPHDLKKAIVKIEKQLSLISNQENQEKINQLITTLSPTNTSLDNLINANSYVNEQKEIVTIKDGTTIHKVARPNIISIEAAGDYICIYTNEKMYMARMTMKASEKNISNDYLCRIHRSTIINFNKIKSAKPINNGNYQIILSNERKVILSKPYRHLLTKIL